ncbi:hypothetical protein [Consotaella aegiceratis]|uniref:hypothetical protein n=1 Tax=Consotaella aegiceratis TaxID=3097961 RepID=UPI002F42A3C2
MSWARHDVHLWFLRLVSRIWHSICDRLTDWLLTGFTLAWGITLAGEGDTFALSSFAVIKTWAPEMAWAVACLIVGFARLALLIINGAWRKSPHLRIAAALGTIPLWTLLSIGYHLAHSGVPGDLIYALCALAEIVSAYRASIEAGYNDNGGPRRENVM